VTSNPAGLDRGDTCSFSPVTGTVTLQAASADGWEFDRWSGDCTGTATDAIVTVDRDKHCTANFRRVDGIFFLTMVVEGQGAVGSEPAGIACPGTCSAQFSAGTAVDLSAQAGLGWTPSFWFDDCAAPAGSTNRVIMNADKQCRIRFVPQPSFPVATFTFPGGARVGRIITFDGTASHVYHPSTLSQDLSGITSFAWDLDGDGVFAASGSRSTNAITQYAFQSSGDHNVRLRVRGGPFDDFDDDVQIVSVQDAEGPLFGLSVSKGGAGQGIVRTDPRGLIECDQSCPAAGPLLLEPGSPVVLTATPDAGSQLGGWTGCDAVTDGRCSVTMTADRAVSVTFVPASGPFTLTVAVNQPPGSFGNILGLEPSGNAISCGGLAAQVCAQSFPAGTTVVVRPSDTSLELGLFSGWSGCDSIGPLFACTVTLTGDRTVTATFAR
jgi:PKD repeat protein